MMVVLWTDWLIYLLLAVVLGFIHYARCRPHLMVPWKAVLRKPLAMSALIVLLFYMAIGFLDSIHFRQVLPTEHPGATPQYGAQIDSVLDRILSNVRLSTEKTYSAPFATHLYSKELTENEHGQWLYRYPPLQHRGHLVSADAVKTDVLYRLAMSLLVTMLIVIALVILLVGYQANMRWAVLKHLLIQMGNGQSDLPWRSMLLTVTCLLFIVIFLANTMGAYHVLGTDKVGEDVLYQAIKSIRTGLVIGTLTTLITLPFAVLLGTMAGYFRGLIDDIIQYIYITLSSIPDILLIAACVLMMQVYMQTHPDLFGSDVERSDFRLLFLCIILGITSWTGLCRLLRAETLKLANLEYVQAAKAMGMGWLTILLRHLVPNVVHLILIVVVLQFSTLVLAEAVLSYLNIGVDPTMYSWGNMINVSRLELAREPIVWWSFFAAFIFMFVLVLSANLFADAIRDAFDPRLREMPQ